jgi:integrase
LLLLTGARRDEIGGLQWHETNLEQGTLSIPGERTKNHHPLHLSLPAAAVSILKAAPRREEREFVFGTSGGPFSRWSWEKLAIDNRVLQSGASVAAWRIHDIRRTVATGMAEIGVAPHVIEAILNHRSGHKAGVAGIYNRATYDVEMRRALALWADYLLSQFNGSPRKIVTIGPVAA